MRNKLFFIGVCCFGFVPPLWAMGKTPPPEEPAPSKAAIRILTLQECYEFALRRSETIAMSREEIEKTKAQWLQAAGEAVGDADFEISHNFQEHQRNRSSSSSSSSVFTGDLRRERTFTLTQPVFQGFKSLGALAGAGSLKKQRRYEVTLAKETLFLEVANAFYAYLAQQKDVTIIQGIHALFQERVRDLTEREKIGRSRAGEVVTAKARMKIIEAELAASRGALAIAGHLLEFYTGLPMENVQLRDTKITSAQSPFPSGFEEVVEERPDVRAAREAQKTAKQAIVVAQSELWPHMDLEMNQYEKREGSQSGIDWDLLFKINVPLGKGGTSFGEIKEAVSSWKQAKLQYELTRKEAALGLKEAHQNWVTAVDEIKALAEALEASEENYQLQKEDYEHNLVNNLDVLEALESLFNTSRDANRAQYRMQENYWKFKVAMGEGL